MTIAAEEVGEQVAHMIASVVWKTVTGIPGLPAKRLEAAEQLGGAGVDDMLVCHGLIQPEVPLPDPMPPPA